MFLLNIRKSYLSARLYEECSKSIGFNITNIIFGEYPLNMENKALNCIILYTKQYIYFPFETK